jgi:hypothetical protein
VNLIVLKGESQNNVLREFSNSITAGLEKSNQSIKLIDLTLHGSTEELNRLINEKEIDGIFSFNAILGDVLPLNFKIPFVAWMVDSPHYHFNRLQHEGGRRHYIFPSKHHVNFINRAKIKAGSSVLLAGARGSEVSPKEWAERNHTLLLAASWMGKPSEFWNNYSQLYQIKIAKKIIEILDADRHVDVLSACNLAANLIGVQFKLDKSWANLASQAQNFIRQNDRIKIVKALARTGLPFTLIGKGWESNVSLGSHVNFIDDLDNRNISTYYGDSKIVININSSNGACERLFDGMSAGACVLSDHSDTLLDHFKDRKDLCLFDRRKPSSIVEAIDYVMKEGKGDLMSSRALKLINEKHLWSHRGEALSEIFNSFRMKDVNKL